MIKVCNVCKKEKSITEFHKQKNSPDGFRYICKKCNNERVKRYRKKDPEQYNKKIKAWRQKNKEKLSAQSKTPERREYIKNWRKQPHNKKKNTEDTRSYRQKNPEKIALISRRCALKSMYGVTLEWYDDTLEKQNGLCAICGADNPRRKNTKNFSVDHDHSTGEVRGLLCQRCNVMVGCADDSINNLLSAVEYLKLYE